MKTKLPTFEECLAHSGTEEEKRLFNNLELLALLPTHVVAYYQLTICARNWNTDADTGKVWQPNWFNTNEWKYYPWMEIKAYEENPAGFGFSFSYCAHDLSATDVGSRLCFPTSDMARYFSQTFADLYKDYWMIPPTQ